jgi:hypothetical protein
VASKARVYQTIVSMGLGFQAASENLWWAYVLSSLIEARPIPVFFFKSTILIFS